jgi:hypothetical protein
MHPLLLTDASTTFLKYHASTAIDYVDNIRLGQQKCLQPGNNIYTQNSSNEVMAVSLVNFLTSWLAMEK